MQTEYEREVICAHLKSGYAEQQWGYVVEVNEVWIKLAYPLDSKKSQTIVIPWHNIEMTTSEDESDAPWM